ncbi:hypothetical protein PVAG01_03226 [Phlyctema vagabunda]|uniref:Chitin synthesis regulation, Congo red resistance, RCR protein n=1 Tax=Phlyctema vagabunda TaxID=108571 RepID=A0ABR4PSX2_9HELO
MDIKGTMNTLLARAVLESRATCTTGRYPYRRTYRCSAWQRFGRWVVAGILVLMGLIFIALFLCLAARRKRRARKYATNPTPMAATHQTYPDQNQGYGYNNGPQQEYGNANNYGQNPPYQQAGYAPPPGPPPATYQGGYK